MQATSHATICSSKVQAYTDKRKIIMSYKLQEPCFKHHLVTATAHELENGSMH